MCIYYVTYGIKVVFMSDICDPYLLILFHLRGFHDLYEVISLYIGFQINFEWLHHNTD